MNLVQGFARTAWKEYRIWVVLALLMAVATGVSKGVFIRSSNLINILLLAAPIGIAAIGETFVVFTAGIDLSVVGTWIMGAVVGGSLSVSGSNVAVAVLAALGAGLVIGMLNGSLVAYLNIPPLITTLGMLSIVEGIARVYRGNQPILFMPRAYDALATDYLGPIPVQILILVAVVLAALLLASRSTIGKEMYAIGGNLIAARCSGVRVTGVLIATYAICGVLAALGGVLHSMYMNLAVPNADPTTLFVIIAGVVVGGTKLVGGEGNVINTIAGVLVVLVIQNVMNIVGISPLAEQGVLGLVTLIAVFLNIGWGTAARETPQMRGV